MDLGQRSIRFEKFQVFVCWCCLISLGHWRCWSHRPFSSACKWMSPIRPSGQNSGTPSGRRIRILPIYGTSLIRRQLQLLPGLLCPTGGFEQILKRNPKNPLLSLSTLVLRENRNLLGNMLPPTFSPSSQVNIKISRIQLRFYCPKSERTEHKITKIFWKLETKHNDFNKWKTYFRVNLPFLIGLYAYVDSPFRFRTLLCRPLPMDIGMCTCVIVKEPSPEGVNGGTLYSLYTSVKSLPFLHFVSCDTWNHHYSDYQVVTPKSEVLNMITKFKDADFESSIYFKTVFLQEGKGRQDRKLAVALCKRRNGKSIFIIAQSIKGVLSNADDSYIGAVTANLMGSKYHIWDQVKFLKRFWLERYAIHWQLFLTDLQGICLNSVAKQSKALLAVVTWVRFSLLPFLSVCLLSLLCISLSSSRDVLETSWEQLLHVSCRFLPTIATWTGSYRTMRAYIPKHQSMQLKNTTHVSQIEAPLYRGTMLLIGLCSDLCSWCVRCSTLMGSRRTGRNGLTESTSLSRSFPITTRYLVIWILWL